MGNAVLKSLLHATILMKENILQIFDSYFCDYPESWVLGFSDNPCFGCLNRSLSS